MNVQAHLRNIRISPRKVRIVAALIRGRNIQDAKTQLTFLMRKAALPIIKLIDSAVANATHNFKIDPKDLYIAEIFVNEGQTLKRGMPRARGSSYTIRKRMSHISLTLAEKKDRNMTRTGKKASQKKKVIGAVAQKVVGAIKKKVSGEAKTKKPGAHSSHEKSAKTGHRLTGVSRRAFHAHEDK